MRAYRPHPSTRALVRDIEALEGVASADIMAPHHGPHPEPAKIVVRLEPSNSSPEGAKTVFSLAEARKWLASERQVPILVPLAEAQDRRTAAIPVAIRRDFPEFTPEMRPDVEFAILTLARVALDGAPVTGNLSFREDVVKAIAARRVALDDQSDKDLYLADDGPLARALALLGRTNL